jgi:RNA polymerase sigma-70 factor (ECF subfamily)
MATERTPVIDREQLAAFRDGRRDVLERMYREHVAEVITFLRIGFMYTANEKPTRFPGVRDSLELEALIQEVFTRAFDPRARLAYDGVRPYAAFVCGIARNLVLDQLRKNARHGEVLAAPEMLDTLPSVESNVDRELSADELRGRELVAGFLAAECDERDRRLYHLRYERELSQVDAASAAGLTRIQVRRWEAKFRGRLLRFLKRSDYVRER